MRAWIREGWGCTTCPTLTLRLIEIEIKTRVHAPDHKGHDCAIVTR